MIIHFITIIIIIVLPLTMTLLSFRMVQSKKSSCQASFQELPGPTPHWLPPMESEPDVCIIAPLSSISKEQGAERYSCWEHMSHPTPSWWPELSLAIWTSLDANSVSREMVEQKVPAPPPLPLPLSPNLWDLTVLPPRDSIVSQQLLYTNKPDYLNVIVRETLSALLCISIQTPTPFLIKPEK